MVTGLEGATSEGTTDEKEVTQGAIAEETFDTVGTGAKVVKMKAALDRKEAN